MSNQQQCPATGRRTARGAEPGSELVVAENYRYADFQALREEWNTVADRAPKASVFLRYEWFDAVWQWQDGGTTPVIITCRDGAALVGILALALRHERIRGFSVRRMIPLQVPDTQEHDLIAAPVDRHRVAAAIADWFHRHRGRWDVLELSALPADTGNRDALLDALRTAGIAADPEPDQVNLSIDLTPSWQYYLKTLTRRVKKNVNLVRNRLEKQAAVDLEWHRGTDARATALAEAIDISARSWKSGLELSLDFEGPRAFIERLTDHAGEQGWLSLWLLRLDGKAVAMEYQLSFAGRVHALRGDFDPAHETLSPGAHLHAQQLQALFATEGLETYLMGPGKNAYKLRWSQSGQTLQALRAWSPTMRGFALRMGQRHLRLQLHRIRRWLSV